MKIFVIPTSYPNEYNAVANIFVYEQVKALAKLGHEIVVLNVIKHGSKDIFKRIPKSVKIIKEQYCTRYAVECKTFLENHFSKYNCDVFCEKIMQLYEIAVKDCGKPDILYAHFSLYAGYAATKLKEKYNLPLVTLEHNGALMQKKLNSRLQLYLEDTLKKSDKFFAVSTGLKRAITSLFNKDYNIDVIPNMLDDSFIFFPPIKKPEFTFFSCGRLVKGKRFSLLIKAFCTAFKQEDKVKLIIGGDGEERKDMAKLIQSNRREEQIILLGRLSREETVQAYINSDCFVLPSKSETFGLVYREAMAVGRPIITTDHGGFDRACWDDNDGIIIDVDDYDALVQALIYVKENIKEFDLQRISNSCLEKYSSEKIAKMIAEIFGEVVTSGKN